MKKVSLIIIFLTFLLFPKVTRAAEFYVATTGSPSGDGSITNPWDIQTALNHPSPVQPGDTIWVRGGTYTGQFTSRLQGSEGNPIILRAIPNERVTFDTQTPAGQERNPNLGPAQHNWWWGMEVTNTQTTNKGGGFLLKTSKNNKFINMVIHDLGGNAFGNGDDIYGSILYNNGNYNNQLGHHLYTQSPNQSRNPDGSLYCTIDPAANPTVVEDSIVFQSFGFGMHAYSGGSGCLINIHMIGSVWFNNGLAQQNGNKKDDILVGGVKNNYFNRMIENMTYTRNALSERTAGLGRYGNYTCDFDIIDNYLIGLTRFHNLWDDPSQCRDSNGLYSTSDIRGNTFGSYSYENADPVTGPGNVVLTSKPTQNKIFIRPNQYENDRANIVVYNWEDKDTVSVDVSAILETGDGYEVRNAQNFYDTPVASGTYDGSLISLPMNAGFNPAQPISPGLIGQNEMTGREFNVFVLIGTSESQTLPTSTPTPLPGDINNDGIVNILDYTLLSNAFGTSDPVSDVNSDGTVNILDYTILSNNFGKTG